MKLIKIDDNNSAIVDDNLFDELSKYKWYIQRGKHTYYARCCKKVNGKYKTVAMHRIITNAKPCEIIDHANGNGLDNRISNLRVSTHSQNNSNRLPSKNSTSKYLGVYFERKRNKYKACITVNKKTITLGRFSDEVTAAKTYNAAAELHHGNFARLNKF